MAYIRRKYGLYGEYPYRSPGVTIQKIEDIR